MIWTREVGLRWVRKAGDRSLARGRGGAKGAKGEGSRGDAEKRRRPGLDMSYMMDGL